MPSRAFTASIIKQPINFTGWILRGYGAVVRCRSVILRLTEMNNKILQNMTDSLYTCRKTQPVVGFLRFAAIAATLSMATLGCKDLYDLPAESEYLSPNINYANRTLEPIIGRTTELGQPNLDNSTQPMEFEIINARYGDGRPVTDIFQVQPVKVWIADYDGDETSLEEIEAKRRVEERPIFEVTPAGKFIFWGSSTDALVEPRPSDAVLLVQDIRFFDLKVMNAGGSTILTVFQLIPWLERPYDPSDDINPYTGGIAPDPDDPRHPLKRNYIRPSLSNVVGAESDRNLGTDNNTLNNVVAYIKPFEGGNGHNLRFVFWGPDSTVINPARFNETVWDELVHGFNRVDTDEYVQYDVAYPIPLAAVQTDYTSGLFARVNFSYSRIGFNRSEERRVGKECRSRRWQDACQVNEVC